MSDFVQERAEMKMVHYGDTDFSVESQEWHVGSGNQVIVGRLAIDHAPNGGQYMRLASPSENALLDALDRGATPTPPDLRAADLRALSDAGTPGPWFRQGTLVNGPDKGGIDIGPLLMDVYSPADAEYIVALVNSHRAVLNSDEGPDGLSEAWAAVEAALPQTWEFWEITVEPESPRVYVRVRLDNVLDRGMAHEVDAHGDTPTAALLALRERLIAHGSVAPEPERG